MTATVEKEMELKALEEEHERNHPLTSKKVSNMVIECLYGHVDDPHNLPEDCVVVEGIIRDFGFRKEKLEANKEKIWEMLSQLPDNFFEGKGGGWSFLEACVTKNGYHWGEHQSIEELFALGIGCGFVKSLLPKEMMSILPGSVPYYVISRENAK